jgi:phage-related tail fiber protein
MPTSNKGLNQPALSSAAWGPPLNDNASIIDKALGAFVTISDTSGTVNLTLSQCQNMCIKSTTSAFLANVTFVVPSGVAGQWVFVNQSAANSFFLVVKNAASPTSVSIPSGRTRTVYSDGSTVTFSDEQPVDPTIIVQPGSVSYFAMSVAPAGYLKANGAAISRTTYAALFAAIGTTFGAGDGSTTFNIPDLRGEFLRGWDDGRGVDGGRAFGSFQNQQTQDHAHRSSIGFDGSRIWGWLDAGDAPIYGSEIVGGANITRVSSTKVTATALRILYTQSALINVSGETRPRNVALLACIKF